MVDDVRVFFEGFAAAHAREDVEGYLSFFAGDTVWVTSRGACYRGREGLGAYLREVIPGGLGDGTVRYVSSRSTRSARPPARRSWPRPTWTVTALRVTHGRRTHTYVLTGTARELSITAGQNTVRT